MQKSVKRGTLWYVPLDVVCGVVDYFEHVEELKWASRTHSRYVCIYFTSLWALCIMYAESANS